MLGVHSVAGGVALIIKIIVPLIITVATTLFLWGVLRYAFSSQHEGEQENGKKLMLYGVVTIFLSVAVWGILNWMLSAVGSEGLESREGASTERYLDEDSITLEPSVQ